MKRIILGLLVSGVIGGGIWGGEAKASGYWDYSLGNRGIVYSPATNAAPVPECETEDQDDEEPCQPETLKISEHERLATSLVSE